MSQYEHARDHRSDEKYLSDFARGTHNQELAIEQYVWDKYLSSNNKLDWNYERNPDKEFQTEGGTWKYQPDYVVHVGELKAHFEVKVQMAPLGKSIYVKQQQIDKLVPLGGYILYALPDYYSVLPAKEWAAGDLVESSPLGGKPAYMLFVEDIKWRKWRYLPPFVNYKEEM